jgi:PKD repeat protein
MGMVVSVTSGAGFKNGTYYLNYVGEAPVNTFHNHIWNNTIYDGEGFAVRIYDISPGVNLSAMTYKSYEDQLIFDTSVQSIKTDDNRLYVLTTGLLSIFDLTDRLNPILLGNVSISGSDVIADGNYAYVAGADLFVIDVSDPENPGLVATCTSPSITIMDYDGMYIYAGYYSASTSGAKWLAIFDVSDPLNPTLLSQSTTLDQSSGVAYHGNTVYVANFANKLQAWDVTNRSAPLAFWNSSNLSGTGTPDVRVVGDYLYVDTRYGSLYIYDVSSPTPVLLGSNSVGYLGYTEDLSTDGTTLAISTNTLGLHLYNVSKKSSPAYLNHLSIPATFWILEPNTLGTIDVIMGSGRDGGTWYWDITNPASISSDPPLTSWNYQPLARSSKGIPWLNNLSYVKAGSNGNGVWILNLTGLENPDFVDPTGMEFCTVDSTGTDIRVASALVNETRYYATSIFGSPFMIWDNTLKETAIPTLINRSSLLPAYSTMYFYHNDYILATADGTNLKVITRSDAPDLVKNWSMGFTYGGGSAGGGSVYYDPTVDMVYALNGLNSTVCAFNVSDIDNFHVEGCKRFYNFNVHAVTSNGTDVFVVGEDAGFGGTVAMVSFSNIHTPQLIDKAEGKGSISEAVAYYKGYLYTGTDLTAYYVVPSSTIPITYPIVNWTSDKTSGVTPLKVTFTDHSYDPSPSNTTTPKGLVTSWLWDFGDGTTSTANVTTHTYPDLGTYNVTLTVGGAEGYNTSAATEITVQATGADFFANRTYNATAPMTVEFTSLAQNGATYEWNFIDGNATVDATTRNAMYTYSESGVYSVRYKVINGTESDTKTRTNYITVGGGVCNDTFTTSASAAGYISEYLPANQTFSSIRNAGGDYRYVTGWDVAFIGYLLSSNGLTDNFTKNYHTGMTFPTSGLEDDATLIQGNITVYTSLKTSALGSPDYGIVLANPANESAWVLGDYDTFTSNEIVSRQEYTNFTVGTRTSFPITNLSVINKTGNLPVMFMDSWNLDNSFGGVWNSSAISAVRVSSIDAGEEPQLNIDYETTCYPTAPIPIADFVPSTTYGSYPLSVNFFDASSNNPTTWNWSFGTGEGYSDSQNPSHTYTGAGEFTVTLIATNTAGSDSVSKNITVIDPVTSPTSSFASNPQSGTAPLNVVYTDHSTNAPTSWLWDFGEGNTSTSQNTEWTFEISGTYNVSLYVENGAGNDTAYQEIVVGDPVTTPVASFTKNATTGTPPLAVQFTDTSTNTPTGWNWSFGDGNWTNGTQNVEYTYPVVGTYTVYLIASNEAGSDRSDGQTVTVTAVTPIPTTVAVGRIGGADTQIFTGMMMLLLVPLVVFGALVLLLLKGGRFDIRLLIAGIFVIVLVVVVFMIVYTANG